jgi:hypothetical protein
MHCGHPHKRKRRSSVAASDRKDQKDLLGENAQKKATPGTSANREESMKKSGSTEQDPANSGTTALGGEGRDGNDRPGPGGVEGEGGTS